MATLANTLTRVAALLLALGAVAGAQPRHVELGTRQERGPYPSGRVEVTRDRIVVAFYYDGQAGHTWGHLLDAATLRTLETWNGPNLQQLRVFEEASSVFWGFDTGEDFLGAFRRLSDGGEAGGVRVPVIAHDARTMYGLRRDGHVQRYDVATGAALWDADLGQGFGAGAALAMGRRGAWLSSDDQRRFVYRDLEGKERARYELPAADRGDLRARTLMYAALPEDDEDDRLVVMLSPWPTGRGGEQGTLYRLIGDGRPKDLVVPGGHLGLVLLGRWDADTLPCLFQRGRGKRYALISGRADGQAGDADRHIAIDLRRWRVAASSPSAPADHAILAGYFARGADVYDLADGKRVVSAREGETIVAMSQQYVALWVPASDALTIKPLSGGAARTVEVPGTSEARVASLLEGDTFIVQTHGPMGDAVFGLDPATGAQAPIVESASSLRIVGQAPRLADGTLWTLVTEGEGERMRLHLYGVRFAP